MINLLGQIDWNWLAVLGGVTSAIGLILSALVQFSRASFAGKTFTARGHKSVLTERFQVKYGIYMIIAGLALILFSQTPFFTGSVSGIDGRDWVGEWTVYLEEMGDFEHSAKAWTLKIEEEGDKLTGRVYNKPDKIEGYLSKIEVEGNELKAKYGRNVGRDGERKMEVEFLMYRNEKTFSGRYKSRSSRKDWKAWVSHKIK